MQNTTNQSEVIKRIRYLLERMKMTQSELARRLSIDPSNMSKHLSGRLPVTESLINRIVVNIGVSKQWLVSGDDVPFSKHPSPEVIGSGISRTVVAGVPVYDIDVTAGTEELSTMFTEDRITGYVSLPRFSNDSLIVRVSGDSMMPEIMDGGMIAIRKVSLDSTIIWGQVYVVVTDDFRRVKYLRRHPSDPSIAILHSANLNYDDIELPMSEIKSLFRVEAIINCKICG